MRPASGPHAPHGPRTRLQRERRFLLPSLPRALAQGAASMIEERYLAGTGLCLRRTLSPTGAATGAGPELTLGQHVRTASDQVERVALSGRLAPEEYAALTRLPGDVLVWRRYDVALSGRPCAVDVFEGDLHGLVLAKAIFTSIVEVWSFSPPVYAVAEVTGDERFAEWVLARTSAGALAALVAEYGMLLR
jgi:hypothetical protein